MLITAFIRTIYVPTRIEICQQYEMKLYSVAEKFSKFLGRPAKLADLTELSVCEYLREYRKSWSARSTNNQRQVLLSIWLEAADRIESVQFLSATPNLRRIRKLPEEIDPPEAWTVGQVGTLLDYSYKQYGMVGTVPANLWWTSLFLSIYYTSCRISSMLAVPVSGLDQGGLLVRKQKNHRPQWFRIPESCCEMIRKTITLADKRKLIWEHPWHPRTVWTKAREIIECAGLPAPMTGRQLFHRLRRTTITLCWQIDQGIAQQTAGHKDKATTLKHYVDPRGIHTRSAADILPDPFMVAH